MSRPRSLPKCLRLLVSIVRPCRMAVQPMRVSKSPIRLPAALRRALSRANSRHISSSSETMLTLARKDCRARSWVWGFAELRGPSYSLASDTMLRPTPLRQQSVEPVHYPNDSVLVVNHPIRVNKILHSATASAQFGSRSCALRRSCA